MKRKNTETTTGNRYLFITTDVYGNKVKLETSQYNEHIIVGHPEMKNNEHSIQEVIENPYQIIESKQSQNRWLYIGKSKRSTYPNLHIKTVVDYSDRAEGYVVTSMFQRKINADKEGVVIYDKGKDGNPL